MTPQLIGRYQVLSELGRGGMATVYRALDLQEGREVALKVLPRALLHDREFRARFRREVEALSRLTHPGIVPIYESGEHDGQPYLAMRLMSAGSLADRLHEGPLSLAETARIVGALAPALDYAHAAGIIHRDLKPANILFDNDGQPFLADFGIVKLSEGTTALTTSGSIGTPDYMAPELARPGGLTPQVDVYALGVTVFQMLTGRMPYQADTPMGVMVAHITEPMPDLRLVRPDLPAAAQALMARALAKDPAMRYASATALASDLAALDDDRAFTGATIRVGEPPPQPTRKAPPRPGQMSGSAFWLAVAAAVAVSLLVVGGALALAGRPGALVAVSATAAPAAAPTMSAATALPAPTVAALLEPVAVAGLPSADKMLIQLSYHVEGAAYSAPLDRIAFTASDPDRLYIYDPVNGDSLALGLPGRPTGLALSPDGAFAAVAAGRQIAYIDLDSGELVQMFDVIVNVDDLIVGAAKTIFVFSHDGGRARLLELDLETGEQLEANMAAAPEGVRYRMLANGQSLYGVTASFPQGVEKIDISGFHAKYDDDFSYDGQHAIGADLWLSADSRSLFSACGAVFSTSDDRLQDMRYRGSLADVSAIRSLYHVAAADRLLVIPVPPDAEDMGCGGVTDAAPNNTLLIYNYRDLTLVDQVHLPALAIGASAYPVHGLYAFANADGTRYYVVVQAYGAGGLTQDFAVFSIDLGSQ